jgi:hypothetical protein
MPVTIPLVQLGTALTGSYTTELGNACGPFHYGGNLYIAVCNPVNPAVPISWANSTPPPDIALLHCYMSADNGATWNELDAAHAVAVTQFNSNGAGGGGYSAPIGGIQTSPTQFVVAFTQWDYTWADPPTLQYIAFNMNTGLWQAISSAGPAVPLRPNTMTVQSRASDGALIFEWDGQSQTVGGLPYTRVFYAIYNAGWTAAIAIDPAQTGSTSNYALSGGVSGTANRTHFFYTADTGLIIALSENVLSAANALLARVTVASTAHGGIVDVTEPWVNGSTIGVSYGLNPAFPVADQYMSVATSADSPAFTQSLIALASTLLAVVPAGVALVGATVDTLADNIYALSQAALGNTWSALTLVGPYIQPDIQIDGFPIPFKKSAGFVVSNQSINPDPYQVFFFAFAIRCLLP